MFGFKRKEVVKPIYVTGCEFNCLKSKCPKWVIMYHKVENEDGTMKTIEEGRCYAAWIPYLIVEQANRFLERLGANNGSKN